MHSSSARRTALAVLSAGALVLPLASPASAASGDVSDPLVEGLIGPLGLSIANSGGMYVAEAFAGMLTRVHRDGTRTPAATAEGGFIAGVDASRMAQAAYVVTGENEAGPYAQLRRLRHDGSTSLLADLAAWEREQNPDADQHYGFAADELSESCASQVPEWVGGGRGYDGIIESNPYAVTATPGGWVVADAAGNSLISVGRNGSVSTLAVLPTHDLVLTQAHVDAVNAGLEPGPDGEPAPPPLPSCVVGATYAFEPVPTDVELGRDGLLYVSTLAGGPEDPSLGARSKVFTVDRRSGAVTELASGFAGATDLAVGSDGSVYVAELFGGQISKVVGAVGETFAEVLFPAAVEYHKGLLYAAVDVFNEEAGGSIVTIQP